MVFKHKLMWFFGIVFMLAGTAFMFNSASNITGFVIAEGIDRDASFVLGVVLFVGGILLFVAGTSVRERESRLESEAGVGLELSDRFIKDIKKHNRDAIYKALRKIGTGQGHEHRLTGRLDGRYSISVGNSGRIIFEYNPDRTEATILGYTSSHDYKQAGRKAA